MLLRVVFCFFLGLLCWLAVPLHFNKENAQVLDIVRQHSLNTEVEVYAFAAVEERQGRRALAAFLAECDN